MKQPDWLGMCEVVNMAVVGGSVYCLEKVISVEFDISLTGFIES